jgi:parafibromin
MTESSTKKPKVAPLVSDDSLITVKQVESREREIMTRSSVLKGTKNFTHAINLAKQLVLGKEVPIANSRSSSSQKPGGWFHFSNISQFYTYLNHSFSSKS